MTHGDYNLPIHSKGGKKLSFGKEWLAVNINTEVSVESHISATTSLKKITKILNFTMGLIKNFWRDLYWIESKCTGLMKEDKLTQMEMD